MASPVKEVALKNGLTVAETNAEVVNFLESRPSHGGITGVVVAYGRIIKDPLLSLIPLVNLHFSLLPRWRGAAPVERAILAGDARTGSSIMQIEEGLDTGGVYDMIETPINDDETCEELRSRLGQIGAAQIIGFLCTGFPLAKAQIGTGPHAEKISSEDLKINWQESATQISRLVRVGGAHSMFRGQRFKILSATVGPIPPGAKEPGCVVEVQREGVLVSTGNGGLCLQQVQAEGKKPMAARDWANGARVQAGEIFGDVR